MPIEFEEITEKKQQKESFWRKYQLMFFRGKFKFPPETWIPISIILSILMGAIAYVLFDYQLYIGALYGFLMFLFFFYGLPYYFMDKRLTQIERQTPYFLTQLASAIRAGMGIDSSLNEVAKSMGGPLGEEIRKTLSEIKKGITFSEAFERMGERIGTKFIKRIFRIIIAAVEQGGKIADILDEIAENAESMIKLKMEREAATTMPCMFLVAAGVLIAPMVFGITIALFKMMYQQAVSIGFLEEGKGVTPQLFMYIIIIYTTIEAFLSALIISKMRWGNIGKGLVFAPAFSYVAGIIAKYSSIAIYNMVSSKASAIILLLLI